MATGLSVAGHGMATGIGLASEPMKQIRPLISPYLRGFRSDQWIGSWRPSRDVQRVGMAAVGRSVFSRGVQNYEIRIALTRGEVSTVEAADVAGGHRSTIVKLRQVGKQREPGRD